MHSASHWQGRERSNSGHPAAWHDGGVDVGFVVAVVVVVVVSVVAGEVVSVVTVGVARQLPLIAAELEVAPAPDDFR